MRDTGTTEIFRSALDALVHQVEADRSILAAILCGSLSHDIVWEKSDIDLVFVTIDDRKVQAGDVSLYADGVNVHAFLLPRADFRRMVEGSLCNSFVHSFLVRGRLLYTHDPTIADLCATLGALGRRDTELQMLHAATAAVSIVAKAQKWFVTRGDLDYSALWILYTATPLARIEVLGAGEVADREVIVRALALNPRFFTEIYVSLLTAPTPRERVAAALEAIDGYLAERAPMLFAPVLEHLREVGEARSCTEIETHFKQHFDLAGVTTACEYLADQGLIGKASLPLQLTKRSNISVQELAFFAPGGNPPESNLLGSPHDKPQREQQGRSRADDHRRARRPGAQPQEPLTRDPA